VVALAALASLFGAGALVKLVSKALKAKALRKAAEKALKEKGVTNPDVPRLPRPSTPEGTTLSQFGKDTIGWGSRPQGALDRISSIDSAAVAKMKDQGLTKDMATQWRDFYSNEFSRNANNITAANRVDLMNKILDNF